jgi:hypothetical protein
MLNLLAQTLLSITRIANQISSLEKRSCSLFLLLDNHSDEMRVEGEKEKSDMSLIFPVEKEGSDLL